MTKQKCGRCGGKGWVEGYSALRAKRLRIKGATLRGVARLMKISPAYLSDLERGKRDWNANRVGKFEAALEQSRNGAKK